MGKGDKLSIELVGGPPWGFRLGGGADFGCPLEIAKLRKKSKAFEAGLEEGDVVMMIDHQDVSSKSHGDAMKIIELAGTALKLNVIKGIGPSAGMIPSVMGETITINKSDGLPPFNDMDQQPVEATVVRSREPSIARSYTEPSRERSRSVSRSITIIPAAKAQRATPVRAVKPAEPVHPAGKPESWTVDVTSYELSESVSAPQPPPAQPIQPASRPAAQNQALYAPQQKQAPPTSPKPKFKASTLPRSLGPAQGTSSCPVLPSWAPPPVEPSLKHHWTSPTPAEASFSPAYNNLKPAPMFKVARVEAKAPAATWQPTVIHNMDYHDSRNQFNPDGVMHSPQPSVSSQPSYRPDSIPPTYSSAPAPPQSSQFIPAPPPPPPLNMSPRKPANHIPGMVNPLICDDSQGDFGANPIVRPNTKPDTDTHSKKKMYSDSAFYDAPGMEYPTIQDQVALCKEIASFLESNQNKTSRGGTMFMKRKQRADQWSMASQGQKRDMPQTDNYDFYNSLESSQEPTRPALRREFVYNTVRHHPDPMKTKLSAAELEQLQHNQDALCKHDAIPPNIAFDINEALAHSRGKAGQFFEKRRQRAEKYVVDENNVKNWQPQTSFAPMQIETPNYSQPTNQSYVSPWQAAMEGQLDKAFPESQPLHSSVQMTQPLSVITNQQHQQQPPQLQVKYKAFKPVAVSNSHASPAISQQMNYTLPRTKTRLEQMLEAGSEPNTAMSSPAPTSYNSYRAPSLPTSSMTLPMNGSYMSSPPASMTSSMTLQSCGGPSFHTTSAQPQPAATSNFTLNLRRPKHYLADNQNCSTSAF